MRMGPQPHDFDILEEGDVHRRRQIVSFIRRDGKFWIVSGSEHGPGTGRSWGDDWRILARALNNELFGGRRLRHSEADLGPVHDLLTVRRVVNAHNDIRPGRHQLSRIPNAVVIVASARYIAKIETLPQGRMAMRELHLRAAHVTSSDNHSGQLSKAAIAGCGIARLVPRYLYPLVAVVHRRRFMLLEAEANVMHHRRLAPQNFQRGDSPLRAESGRQRKHIPLQNALSRHFMRRPIQKDFRLATPTGSGPLHWRMG